MDFNKNTSMGKVGSINDYFKKINASRNQATLYTKELEKTN